MHDRQDALETAVYCLIVRPDIRGLYFKRLLAKLNLALDTTGKTPWKYIHPLGSRLRLPSLMDDGAAFAVLKVAHLLRTDW